MEPILERTATAVPPPTDDPPVAGYAPATERDVGSGTVPPATPPGGGHGPRARGNVPAGVAIAVIVVVAALLTYLGMLTQIWANISGAQLPAA